MRIKVAITMATPAKIRLTINATRYRGAERYRYDVQMFGVFATALIVAIAAARLGAGWFKLPVIQDRMTIEEE